ncbi:MAG: Hsp20/alpha crystallin family protein [Phycisphaerae bacterium]|nr:Hsp20/alpha crystallin family protein [Phycisphaerae bacterium]
MAKKDEQVQTSTGFGLGGLFEGIQKLMEAAAGLQGSDEINKTQEFTIPGLGEKGKGIFGFSIRNLAGETPSVKVQPFGNIHKRKEGMVVEEAREPVVDTFEEGDRIRVIAELPGVSESDLKYEIEGDILTISTNGERPYNAEVLLPAAVEPGDIESSYNNGILELKLKKAG